MRREETSITTNHDFTGKVAFVTGSTSGIGRATALAFARAGASVTVADVSEDGNRETARMIEEAGGRIVAVRCDVSDASDVRRALDLIRINAVCPGIIDTPMMLRITEGTPEGLERVISQEPVGRMGKPEEIAAAVMFLRSDLGAFTVGHAMVVDGGQTAG